MRWKYAFEILARIVDDKSYNVYLACINCFENLLNFIQHDIKELSFSTVAPYIKPIFQTILLKCGDSNKRIAERSRGTILHWCSNGLEAMNQLSKQMNRYPESTETANNTETDQKDCSINSYSISFQYDYETIDLILHFINEELQDLPLTDERNIKYTIGRLSCLNFLLKTLPTYFLTAQQGNNRRLMLSIDFVFRNLQHAKPNVHKLSRQIFLLLSEMAIKEDAKFYGQFIRQLINTVYDSDLRRHLSPRIDNLILRESKINSLASVKEKDFSGKLKKNCQFSDKNDFSRKKSCNKENNWIVSNSHQKQGALKINSTNLSNRKNKDGKNDLGKTSELQNKTNSFRAKLVDISNSVGIKSILGKRKSYCLNSEGKTRYSLNSQT